MDSATDKEILERKEEFIRKYDTSQVESVIINFKENVVLKNIHNFDDVTPEDVNDMIWNLKN